MQGGAGESPQKGKKEKWNDSIAKWRYVPGRAKRMTFLLAHSLEAWKLMGIPQEVISLESSAQGM